MAYSDNSFDAVWEELRKGNPELIAKVDQRVAEILSREKQRGCPPDRNPGFCDDPDEEICDRCWASWEKRKLPITNGDRIRGMSDEEIANSKILCPYTAVDMDMCEKWITSGDTRDCVACALDWLKKEEQS